MSIAQTGISTGRAGRPLAVFVAIASLRELAPVALYLGLGDRAAGARGAARAPGCDGGGIMAALFLLIGVSLIG